MKTANECQCLEGIEKMLRTHKEHVRILREAFESEGEKDWMKEQQKAHERISGYRDSSGEAGLKFDEVPLPTMLNIAFGTTAIDRNLALKINEILAYLEAHHGNE